VVPRPDVTLEAAEDAMDAAISTFLKEGVDPEQLKRIKAQMRAEQIYSRDSAERVANRYGRALAIGLSVQDVHDWPDILEAVTAEDIMQAARDVFNPAASVTGWLMREEVTQ
jgi:zinc protease